MAVMYEAETRADRLRAVLADIDAGGAGNRAKIRIGSGSGPALGTVLAEIELNHPSFAVIGDGSATGATGATSLQLSVTPAVETGPSGAVAGGTASSAQILDGNDDVVVFGLTVGTTGGSEVQLNSVNISAGQTVTITSGVITHSHGTAAPS